MAFVTAWLGGFPHLFPLPSFQLRRRSFSQASYRKTEDRREICDRVCGLQAHNFLPNVQC